MPGYTAEFDIEGSGPLEGAPFLSDDPRDKLPRLACLLSLLEHP